MEDLSKLSSLPIKEAVVVEGKVEGAEKTFFFERHDGSILSVQEREAWGIMKGRTSIVGFRHKQPKLLGVSDGQIFQRAVLESQSLIREGKVEEARALIRKGQEEELEKARGNMIMPRDFDTIDRQGNPIKISDLKI
jgi:hypothetical protein